LNYPDRSALLFICALPGVGGFKPNCEGDPEICKLLGLAKRKGITLRAISLHFDPVGKAVVLENPDLPVYL
jgi:DNA-binding sugar fermentation-stimulating protein